MLSKFLYSAVHGHYADPVEIEFNSAFEATIIVFVGLPDAAVKESKDRVFTAMSNSGYNFPLGRTTINLAPADVKKEGPSFDLPIALGILKLEGNNRIPDLEPFCLAGELALSGQ